MLKRYLILFFYLFYLFYYILFGGVVVGSGGGGGGGGGRFIKFKNGDAHSRTLASIDACAWRWASGSTKSFQRR
jgi:hypothetical protein